MKKGKKEVWLLCVSIILTGAFLCTLIYDFSSRTTSLLRTNIFMSLSQMAEQSKNRFVAQLEHEQNEVRIAANSIGRTGGFYTNNTENLLHHLENLCENSNFNNVVYTNLEGNMISSNREQIYGGDQEYFKEIISGEDYISEPFKSRLSGDLTIVVGTPIFDNDNKIIGSLHGSYYLGENQALFLESEYKDDFYGYITANDGNVLLHSNSTDLLNDEKNLVSFYSKVIYDEGFGYQQLVQAMEKNQSGTFGYTYNNAHRYVSFIPVGLNGWYSFTVSNGDLVVDSFLKIRNIMLQTALKLILLAVSIIGLIVLYRNRKEKQIEALNKQLREEIDRAYYDTVTGHDNYARFKIRAEQEFADHPNKKYVISYTDIKNFKYVNDAYGFEIGNRVLYEFAQMYRGNTILFARVNAANFVALSEYESEEDVKQLCESDETKIFDASKVAAPLDSLTLYTGVYCTGTHNTLSFEAMIDRATIAVRKLKETKPGGCMLYDEDFRLQMLFEQRLENRMKSALENNEFKVYIQPKIDIFKNKIVACEALARWHDPEEGLISPMHFIPLFERNGFIRNLDFFMFRTVCKTMRGWLDKGYQIVPVSVNVSKLLLNSPNFMQDYIIIKEEFNIPDGLLEVEFTESLMFDNSKKINEVLMYFRENGVKSAIDDFGAGYSSLNLLKSLPADVLKIDKAFFDENEYNDREKAIIQSVVSMANKLKMQVVAEGVECLEQVEFLKSIQCGVVQGYVFDKPMPIETFEQKYIRNL